MSTATTSSPRGSLDLHELQTVQEQLERQRQQLSALTSDKGNPERHEESVAVLTWLGGSTSAIIVRRKVGRVWLRTVGTTDAPHRVNLCPGLDGAVSSELVVHARFEFSDGVLLELKLP